MNRPWSAWLSGTSQNVSASRGCAAIGEPEIGRQVAGDLLPGGRPVVRAIDAVVVALVERLRLTGGHRELVDALAGLRIGSRRVEFGADADVARLPGRAAVAGLEDADGRDPDPRPVRVGRVGDDRVQDQPAGARLPGRPRRVVGQALDVPPGRAAVLAAEEAGGLDPGEQRAIGRRRERPDVPHRLAVVAVGQPGRGMGPGGAVVIAPPDRRAVPRVPGGDEERTGPGLGDDVVDGPAFAQRAAHGPVAPVRVALEDESALLGPDQQSDIASSSVDLPQPPALNG